MSLTKIFTAIILFAPTLLFEASEQSYVAFSLREAQRLVQSGGKKNSVLQSLGGITRIVGVVHDREGKDVVLVGRKVKGQPDARFDDLVVALHNRLILPEDEWPLVSIDPTPATHKTGRQAVSFKGGIAGTPFGKDFLDCDILLKKYSLELISPVAAVPSYKTLCLNKIQEQIKFKGQTVVQVRWLSPASTRDLHGKSIQAEESLQTKFWFYPLEPMRFDAKSGVFCIKELRLGVAAQFYYADKKGQPLANQSIGIKLAGEAFAKQFTENFQRMTSAYSTLKRLKILYDLVAVAEGIRNLQDRPDFTYLLKSYEALATPMLKEYELIQLLALVERSDGMQHAIQISGGIDFKMEMKWLNYDDVAPLRDVVLKSRPRPEALTWILPLESWKMPNSDDLKLETVSSNKQSSTKSEKDPGFSLTTQSFILGEDNRNVSDQTKKFFGFPPPPPPPPAATAAPRIEYAQSLGGIDIAPEPQGKPADLKKLRDSILKSRPSKDSLSYPVKTKKQD